jgi:hypothetical protein
MICNDRGKKATREECNATMKKYAQDSQDEFNIGRISHVIRQIVWPCNKILPQRWLTFREHPQSMCQLIMTKLAIPYGMTQEEFWDTLIRDATNDKFCNLRASIKN